LSLSPTNTFHGGSDRDKAYTQRDDTADVDTAVPVSTDPVFEDR
jgi:hypothetical protein